MLLDISTLPPQEDEFLRLVFESPRNPRHRMLITSFSKTLEFLPPAGNKSETRRTWSDCRFTSWAKAWDEGRIYHRAYDIQARNGGRCIGLMRLCERPYRQRLFSMGLQSLAREGTPCSSIERFVHDYFEGEFATVVSVIHFDYLPWEALEQYFGGAHELHPK